MVGNADIRCCYDVLIVLMAKCAEAKITIYNCHMRFDSYKHQIRKENTTSIHRSIKVRQFNIFIVPNIEIENTFDSCQSFTR